jgi:hypothetical protein
MRLDFLMETRSGIPKANVKVMLMGTERCWHLEMPKDFQKDSCSETPKVKAICWWKDSPMAIHSETLMAIARGWQTDFHLEKPRWKFPQEKEKRKETDLDFHLDLQMAIQTAKDLLTPMDSHSDFHLAKRRGFEKVKHSGLDLSTPMAKHLGCRSGMPRGWHSETVRCLPTERPKVNPRERQMDS